MCTVDRTPARRTIRPRIARTKTKVLASVLLALAAAPALAPQESSAQARGNANDTNAGASAQRRAQDEAPTLEQLAERVAALERLVASLDTRLSVVQESVRPPPDPRGQPESLRIDDLERQMAQLRLDLQRVQTRVDGVARTAENAQRSAMQAENTARDALFRASR